jgi:hypothetical protein
MIDNLMTIDERKVIRKELYSKVFPSLTITLFIFLIIIFVAIFNIGFEILFITLSFLSLIIGLLAFLIFTKSLRKDLKSNVIKLDSGVVTKKEHIVDYEPGSATLPVTILSIFTLKIFTREMKQVDIYTACINNEIFDLKKDDYEKTEIEGKICIRKAYHSGLFLRLEKYNN